MAKEPSVTTATTGTLVGMGEKAQRTFAVAPRIELELHTPQETVEEAIGNPRLPCRRPSERRRACPALTGMVPPRPLAEVPH